MFRSWITRNLSLRPATGFHVHSKDACSVQVSLLVRSGARRLCNISYHQRRWNHEGQGKASYMMKHGNEPLIDETIGKLLGTAAERWPDQECLISLHQGIRLTFSDLIRRADRLAAGLMKLGMKRGDRLGIWGPDDAEWLITFMSAVRGGFILVAINPTYQVDEVTYCLQKVGVKAVISPDNFKTQNYPRMLLQAKQSCPTLEHIIIYSTDHVTGTRRFSDVEELASKIEVERIAAEQDSISCHSGSNIQFTSGTTGKPKATLLSHRSLFNNSKQGTIRAGYTAGERVCMNVPFFHAFGTLKGLLSMLHTGFTLVLHSRSYNPVKSLDAIMREKCTVVYGTPTMWINLLDAHQRLQPSPISLNYGLMGGAPAAPDLFRKISETFNFDSIKTETSACSRACMLYDVKMIYGLTETTGINFHSLLNEDKELTCTTVGHVANHTECMVVDENGNAVPFGTPGELWIRGYCTMLKYWNDEESTKKTFTEDGWLKTGDRFILRSDGYGHIVGRLKDMLIRGGENIFPKEIEDILMSHPLVLEAQVIGAYDKVYGEEVCACVRLRYGAKLGKEVLREYCKGRIAPFKIPRYVVFVDEYPKTASGKVQKFELKKELEERGIIPATPDNGISSSTVKAGI